MQTTISYPQVAARQSLLVRAFMDTRERKDGGEGGIRTLDTLLTYTPLAGERLQPLGHFSDE